MFLVLVVWTVLTSKAIGVHFYYMRIIYVLSELSSLQEIMLLINMVFVRWWL